MKEDPLFVPFSLVFVRERERCHKQLGHVLRFVLAVSLLSTLACSGSPRSSEGKFMFALIGDIPYDAEQEAKFFNLIKEINQARPAFVVHDGDIKKGSTPCSDEVFRQRYELFQMFESPFIFIFGDNEWTDCYRPSSGSYDPVERLTKLRDIFTQGDYSLGQSPLRLTRQSENSQYAMFRENVRWIYGNVLFIGLNIPGSNNNFGRVPEADAEYAERNVANMVWMKEGFKLAKEQELRGTVLIIQANPQFELAPTDPRRSGYNDFLTLLREEILMFKKPVVLVHRDSHYFRIDKPLRDPHRKRRIANFTRVETFGSPDVHWVRGIVDTDRPEVFSFQVELVEANLP